jgi:hypothetical protein
MFTRQLFIGIRTTPIWITATHTRSMVIRALRLRPKICPQHPMTEWRMREKMRDDERIIEIVWFANGADAINLQRMQGYLRTSPKIDTSVENMTVKPCNSSVGQYAPRARPRLRPDSQNLPRRPTCASRMLSQ